MFILIEKKKQLNSPAAAADDADDDDSPVAAPNNIDEPNWGYVQIQFGCSEESTALTCCCGGPSV